MKTNFKLTLAAIIGFVAGGSAGFFFQTADTTEDSAKGDITKVAKFNRKVVNPTMSAFQERITSSPDEFNKASASLTVLTSRMAEFNELVDIAVMASEGYVELIPSVQELLDVKQLASNASANGIQALEALNAIQSGTKSDANYEQTSQNLTLAFMMVDRQINVGKQYVCDVDAFLRGKNIDEYGELAFARDLWAAYCAGEAVLTGDDEELAYWSKQQNLLTSGTSSLAQTQTFEKINFGTLQQCLEIDHAIGLVTDAFKVISATEQVEKITLAANEAQRFILNDEQTIRTIGAIDETRPLFSNLEGIEKMLEMTPDITSTLDANQMMRNILPIGTSIEIAK